MNRPKSAAALATIALTALALAGCGSSGSHPTASGSSASTVESASFPVTVAGTTLNAKPTHIISMSPTATDMLFTIGAGSQVIAVDKNSDYFGANPPATTPPADIDAFQPNAEEIAAKNPDLVVLSDDINKIKDALVKLKIPVYVAPAATTLEDTYNQMVALGRLTGHPTAAATAVAAEKKAISDDLAKLKPRSAPLTFYYELDQTYYSVTSKTFLGSLFTMAHMTNIADAGNASNPYPQLSAEVIVKADPDVIFLADTECCKQSETTVAARPGWSTISAVKTKQVVPIPDDVASQWGSRVPALLETIVNESNAAPTP
ncbi:MAG TPA: ABC transporter substrate-binding protein [Micromonosporaceae bacterium]